MVKTSSNEMVLTFCPFWQSLGFSADLDNFGSISIINCDQFWTFQDFWGLWGLLCLPLGFSNPFLKPTHPLDIFRQPKSWITTVGVNGGLFLVGAHRAATTPTHSCMLPPPPTGVLHHHRPSRHHMVLPHHGAAEAGACQQKPQTPDNQQEKVPRGNRANPVTQRKEGSGVCRQPRVWNPKIGPPTPRPL